MFMEMREAIVMEVWIDEIIWLSHKRRIFPSFTLERPGSHSNVKEMCLKLKIIRQVPRGRKRNVRGENR